MGGSGVPEGCFNQPQLSKGKVSVSVQGSLCSGNAPWKIGGNQGSAEATEDMQDLNFTHFRSICLHLLFYWYSALLY